MKPDEAKDPSRRQALAEVRVLYTRASDSIGRLPGENLSRRHRRLLDKLAARMVSARLGVRLYDGLLAKLEARGGFPGGPEEAELAALRQQTLDDEHSTRATVVDLGGDYTQLTPSADLAFLTYRGVRDVVVDPRTTLLQALEAVGVFELAELERWEGLCRLGEASQLPADLGARIDRLCTASRQRLDRLRSWLTEGER